ncbi:MAG TPA: ribonuclease R, partial [Thermoanaerobaculia bacterium]|nr:ribonuclease R [Thermoanaerobaculia bacterium]
EKGEPRRLRGKSYLRGEVTRVLEREHRTVVGRFHHGDPPWVRPFDVRIDTDIEIDPEWTREARDGQMVHVEIERYPDGGRAALGRVIEVLGFIWEPGVDIEIVIRKFGIAHEFPGSVLAAAEEVPLEVDAAEIERRVDLRDHVIVTIDGETAKDFDDAVEVIALDDGGFRLGVHIADVSHYVREGSLLDREALERATSVYFPGRAIPMLPERLSNGICSLNPRVDRLTFSVNVDIDPAGRFSNAAFFRSVIRTRERMTYTDVNEILQGPPPELEERYESLLGEFARMHRLYEILRARRTRRGSIDFDLPQHEVLLTEEGEIESILASERNVAHRLIEEFMLATNEVVAQHLVLASQPGLYRTHLPPDPQKIEDLQEILGELGFKLRGDPEEIQPGQLQRILQQVERSPEERFLTELVLRSMTRAFYSEESTGHFALALQHYTHFTSPIRRYPDLVVHRRLGELIDQGALHGEPRDQIERALPLVAQQSSDRERRAEEAEREVLEWKKVIFMRDKVGNRYPGRVTGVAPFGLFVELQEIFVQGLVPVASIGGDFWQYLDRQHRLRGEQTSREFRLGDQVVVEVAAVDEDRRQIEFRLIEASGVVAEQRKTRRR